MTLNFAMRSGLWYARAPINPPASRRLLNCTALIELSPVFASWTSSKPRKGPPTDLQRLAVHRRNRSGNQEPLDNRGTGPGSRWRNVTANALGASNSAVHLDK